MFERVIVLLCDGDSKNWIANHFSGVREAERGTYRARGINP